MSPRREGAPAAGAQVDFASGSAFALDDFESVEMDEPDPSEYFQLIPSNISATRLPGTVERMSPLLILGLIVLIPLNVVAAYVLIQSLAG
jgi:hypothetical protein